MLDYEGNKIAHSAQAPFAILDDQVHGEMHRLKLRMNPGARPNDVLQYMLPLATITHFEEVIPTMHEIFITTVNNQAR